jgi:hypothetical protein
MTTMSFGQMLVLCWIATSSVVQGFLGHLSHRHNRIRHPCLYAIQSSLVSVQDVVAVEGTLCHTNVDGSPVAVVQHESQILYHINFKNFWRQTRAHFVPCERPLKNRAPDFKSKGSWYWDMDDEYVIRSSDHWSNSCGSIKDCFWTFQEEDFRANSKDKSRWLTGKCNYADFERGKKSSMRLRMNDRKI